MSLGQKMKERRSALGLSLQDVASRASLTKAHVWELEVGRSTNPRLDTLINLAAALQMTAVDLFREYLQ